MKTSTDNLLKVQAQAKSVLPDDIVTYIEECLKTDQPESNLISVLHKVQSHFGYLDGEHLDAVAQLLQLPSAKVSGVATFYHFFRLEPRGKYVINVCLGTACYVKGAQEVADRLKEELGIDFGETSGDGMFTLEGARCVGTCALAPVIMIDDKIHGELTPDHIPALLAEYRAKE